MKKLLLASLALAVMRTPADAVDPPLRTWEVVSSPTTSDVATIAHGNGLWLARGERFLRSTNGTVWHEVDATGVPEPDFADAQLFHEGGRFLLRGSGEEPVWRQSVDGTTWTPFPVPAEFSVRTVTHVNGRWVAGGSRGGLAWALEPGNWHVDSSVHTLATFTAIIHFGGRYYAFAPSSLRTEILSSIDGETWTSQPALDGVFVGRVQLGEIEQENGSAEPVIVHTGTGTTFWVGRALAAGLEWEAATRTTFGTLVFRKSADAGRPSGFRREWVNLEPCCYKSGPQVYSLTTPGEVPIVEQRQSSADFLAMAVGPDAMIAVGTGGLIRRYPTGNPTDAAETSLNLQIRSAVELKWDSKEGRTYQIQRSDDMVLWENHLPSTLPGTGSPMSWTVPATDGRKYFRVLEF